MTTIISDAGVQFADNSVQASAAAPQIMPMSASVAANALTITLNPCALSFRSTTLSSGAVTAVNLAAAISLTISSGSTLGTVNAQQSRIVVLAINNAGTIELAAVNIAGGNDLSETGLISTTAEGGAGAADSGSVIYSTTARSNVPYRVVGYVESTQATAGTWVTAPSTIQGQGGQALAAMSSLGYGQTWQNVAGSRAVSTTYYNTTGKPIQVSVAGSTSNSNLILIIGGVSMCVDQPNTGDISHVFGTVPPGSSYSATYAGTINNWSELR